MKMAWRDLLRSIRYHHLRVVHRSRDPHGAAQSFALGIFLGFMPISMLATVLALLIPRRLGWRTIPAVVGTLFGNWITAPFIMGSSVLVGRLITTGQWTGFKELIPPENLTLAEKATVYANLGWSFFVGITLVSLVSALLAYFLVHYLVRAALRLRQEKILQKLKDRLHHAHEAHQRAAHPHVAPPPPPAPPPPSPRE